MFDPVTLNGRKLRNQIVLSPFIEYQAGHNGMVSEQILHYYRTLAQEGVGLIIIESAYVTQQGKAHASQLGINTERHMEGLKQLIGAIHDEGASVALRLAHAGARTS